MTRMNNAGNPMLIAALAYAKRGWHVTPCQPKAKTPASKHGYKDATTEKVQIIQTWTRVPNANVAIATGLISGLVVLDIDPRNGGDASLSELERRHGPLPDTLQVTTGGGGRHFYFAVPPDGMRSGKLAEGIDVKADGGYVIAPPSIHPSGGQYKWVTDPKRTTIARCPDWVTARNTRAEEKCTHQASSQPDGGTTSLGRAFAALGMLGRRLDGGKRTVHCPWQDKHTSGSPHDSSTVIFPASEPDGLGGFHCSHSHCAGRSAAEVMRELERRISSGTTERAWMADLRRAPKGEVKASFGNVVLILTHDPRYAGRIRQDEMRGSVVFADLEMTDAIVSGIRVDLENRYSIQPADAETARAVQFVASRNSFHPVRDWLLTLKWDGVPRLHRVARDILRVRADCDEEAELSTLLVRRWFICLVARPLEPGCKVDTALILEGAQGIGKSSFFRVIAGDWFSDTEMALDKDAMMQLRAAWIYEWAELENVMSRQSVSRVKAFMSSTEDKYRPPFGRTPVTVKRSGVIVGTTNDQDFLHDPSGSRRFWVVSAGQVDLAMLRQQRELLLAEAVAAYRIGERRWLNDAEEARREALSSKFLETDPWEDRVIEYAGRQEVVRAHDVLLQALNVSLDRLTRRDEMRVTQILRRNGYQRRQSRLEGKVQRYWVRCDRP